MTTPQKSDSAKKDDESKSDSEKVYVKLRGPVWNRYDPDTKKVHRHRRGEKFYISRAEYDRLYIGRGSSVVEVEEEDED